MNTNLSNIEFRDAFIDELFSLAQSDRNIIFISNEYGAPSLDRFREDLKDQFINAGISEQNLISVAAGLALSGKRVYVYSIASFITLRCYEQIKIDICSMCLPVTIIGVGTGYAYSVDGPTHHATEDISIMRALAHMHIYSPADSNSAARLVDISLQSSMPLYFRFDKGKYPLLYEKNKDLSAGFSVLHKGKDLSIIATGSMVHNAVEIASELEKYSIKTQVIDIFRLKPVNAHELIECVRPTKRIITIEEHTIHGGLGSIMAEILADAHICIPLQRFAIKDEGLYAYGIRENLLRECGLDKESIIQELLAWNEERAYI
ncbi:MAG: transketolase family protein [bacterium]